MESRSEPLEAVDEIFEYIEEAVGLVDQDVVSGSGDFDETPGDELGNELGCGLSR